MICDSFCHAESAQKDLNMTCFAQSTRPDAPSNPSNSTSVPGRFHCIMHLLSGPHRRAAGCGAFATSEPRFRTPQSRNYGDQQAHQLVLASHVEPCIGDADGQDERGGELSVLAPVPACPSGSYSLPGSCHASFRTKRAVRVRLKSRGRRGFREGHADGRHERQGLFGGGACKPAC